MTLKQFIFQFRLLDFITEDQIIKTENKTDELIKLAFIGIDSNKTSLLILNNQDIFDVNPKITVVFSKIVGLLFIHENEEKGNVCFANSNEIRNDFKTTLTKSDILYYTLGCLKKEMKEANRTDIGRLKLPKTPEEFWKIVQLAN